jgi:uncharacterized protein YhfF/predicted enzyme related to lactoylglutathione lyase
MERAIAACWARYVASVGGVDPGRFYEAFHFGDSEELADDLAALVLAGTKRATAGAVWSYEAEGKALPRPGDLSVVTDWAGIPVCVIETIQVDVVPFDAVTAEFASVEGEGDGSLEYWREGHTQYFNRECSRLGRTFSGSMPVACERFRVIFQEVQMRRVTGIGGIFMSARDPRALRDWYKLHLGIDVQDWGGTAFTWADSAGNAMKGTTVWSIGPADGKHFSPSKATFMVNYRVEDLDALLKALRAEGCNVLEKVDDSEYGKFGWVIDPEGNKVELWQPPEGQ